MTDQGTNLPLDTDRLSYNYSSVYLRMREAAMTATANVDVRELERRVKDVYRSVALRPQDSYHFEMGRALAERLGYPAELLDRVPAAAIESFAGVGYYPWTSRRRRWGSGFSTWAAGPARTRSRSPPSSAPGAT
jgi:hypothetical protein